MSSDVVLTAALRNNLLSLQNTQRLIDTTQLRLATGLKVNSALDGPQAFFAAQSLNNRAGDLGRLLDGISQSIRTIEEADNGITALTTLVQQAESVASEAESEIRSAEGFATVRGTKDLRDIDDLTSGGAITANDDIKITFYSQDDGVVVGGDINIAANDTVYDLVAAINTDTTNNINDYVRASVDSSGRLVLTSLEEGGLLRVGDGTTSPGADGFAFLGLDNIVGTENTAATTRQGGTSVAGRIITSNESTGTPVNGEYFASDTLLAAGYVNGALATDTVSVGLSIDGGTAVTATVAETDTIQDLLDQFNTDQTLQDAGVNVRFNTDTGRIEIEVGDNVGTLELSIGPSSANNLAASFGFGTAVADDADVDTTETFSELYTFVGTSVNIAQYESDFNNIRDQIDDLVEDASYRGVNLLNGDNLTTYFNEDRSNSLVSEGVDFTALGLGIAEAEFTDIGDVTASLEEARSALLAVRNFGQSIANDLAIIQTRRDFTEKTINTLESGADDLVVADQNEEGANLLALQTRQALGTTSLSLASQSQQSVLRLF